MKTTLGWMTFGLALLFALGQYVGAVQCVWFPTEHTSVSVSFIGFGVPMVVLAAFVAGLWSRQPHLRSYLGWTSTCLALLWGVTLLLLVATWAGMLGASPEKRNVDQWITLFMGFLSAVIVCGTGGVALLAEPATPSEESERTLGDTGRAMQAVKTFPQRTA